MALRDDGIPAIVPRRHPVTGQPMPTRVHTRPERSEQYMAHVRAKACCHCVADAPSDPHHLGREGLGQKVHDYRCVPLCRKCHDEVERTGQLEFWGEDTRKELELVLARQLLNYFGLPGITVHADE
jgi:hypothetical protein